MTKMQLYPTEYGCCRLNVSVLVSLFALMSDFGNLNKLGLTHTNLESGQRVGQLSEVLFFRGFLIFGL